MRIGEVSEYITNWIRNYANDSKIETLIVGVSGGIDSAVVSTLCAKTGLKTILLEMPIYQHKDQVSRSKNHISYLKSKYKNVISDVVDLTEPFDSFIRNIENHLNFGDLDNKQLNMANIRSRLRMVTLYSFSNCYKGLVVGTGNKVEDFGVGFFTIGGDGQVDISPIADLMKSEVYLLGKHLGVSEDILSARPTDGLWDDGKTDEEQIGATYDELEWAMEFVKENWYLGQGTENGGFLDYDFETNSTIVGSNPLGLSDRQKTVLQIYIQRHNANKHKMLEIPVCKIPSNLYNV